jgi:hypothetical protein
MFPPTPSLSCTCVQFFYSRSKTLHLTLYASLVLSRCVFLLRIVIFLFLVIARLATLAQSSAALSNAPVIPGALAQKITLAGVPDAGKMNDSLLRVAPVPHSFVMAFRRFRLMFLKPYIYKSLTVECSLPRPSTNGCIFGTVVSFLHTVPLAILVPASK